MPLGNGQAASLKDEKARYLMEPVKSKPSQEAPQGGLTASMQTGLFAEHIPAFRQQVTPRPGVIDAFVKTCQRWGLSDKQQVVLLGYADNEFLGLQLLEGRWLRAPQDVKDRAGYILGISIGLGALFDESVKAEVTWLNTSHPKLHGDTPLSVMFGGHMSSLMTVAQIVAEERELY